MRVLPVMVALLAAWSGAATGASRDGIDGRAEAPSGPCAPPYLGRGAGEGRNDATTLPRTVGTLRIATLFVDFADAPGVFDTHVVHAEFAGAVRDWYRTVSYGRLEVVLQPVLKWVRLPRTLREYESSHFEGAIEAATRAVADEVDFATVDAIVIVTATDGRFRIASAVLEDDPLRVDGAPIYTWAWLSLHEPLAERARVLIHEVGHLLGLPDLYVTGVPSSFHRWDLMASQTGGGMLGWHRWKLGWLDEREVACLTRTVRRPARIRLAPLERPGGRKLVIVRLRRAAIVAEVRQRLAEDIRICKRGVLVYRVDLSQRVRRFPVIIVPAQRRRGRERECGNHWSAPLDLGRGNVAAARSDGVEVRVVRRLANGSYDVRVASASR